MSAEKKIFEVLHRNLHADFEVQLDLVSKHVAAERKSSFRIHPTSVRKLQIPFTFISLYRKRFIE